MSSSSPRAACRAPLRVKHLVATLALPGLLGFAPLAAWAQASPSGATQPRVAVRQLGVDQQAEVFYLSLLGEMLVREQQWPDAVQAFIEAAHKSGDPALYRRASEIAWRAGMPQQALAAARSWADVSPGDADARRVLAQMYAASNQPRQALPYLQRELANTPDAARGPLLLSMQRVLDTATDKAAALDVTRELLANDMNRPEGAVALARAQFAAGRVDDGWASLERASSAKPDLAAAAVTAIENYDKGPDNAAGIGRRYALAAKDVDAVTIEVLRRLAVSKREVQAVDLAQQLTTQHPDSAELWLVLGNLRDQIQQPDGAELAYLQALKLAQAVPADKQVVINSAGTTVRDATLVALAASAERRKDYAKAQDWASQIGADELRTDARVRLIGSALRAKDMAAAWKMVGAMPEASAQDRQLKWSLSGEMLREEGKYAESMAMYDKALAEAPDNADLYYEASFTAEKLKRYDRMEELLRRSIALKPHFAQAYNALGYTLADRGVRLDEARTLLDKALALSPDDAYIIDSMGWLDYRSGRKDDALKQLQKAFALKADPEIAAHLGEVQWELGRKDDAIKTWRSAAAAHADNDALRETMKRYRVQF